MDEAAHTFSKSKEKDAQRQLKRVRVLKKRLESFKLCETIVLVD